MLLLKSRNSHCACTTTAAVMSWQCQTSMVSKVHPQVSVETGLHPLRALCVSSCTELEEEAARKSIVMFLKDKIEWNLHSIYKL